MLYLTNRAIGQSAMTREYLFSLEEAESAMPSGPLLLQVESLVGALQTEVRDGERVENTKIISSTLNMNSEQSYNLISCLLWV